MDRPNLSPEHTQDTDSKESTLIQAIKVRYADHPHFVMKKGGGTSYVSLEDALPICDHYAGRGYTAEALFEMLDDWNNNARVIMAKAAENPEVEAALEEVKQDTKLRLPNYLISIQD